jgi:hypothetical protein
MVSCNKKITSKIIEKWQKYNFQRKMFNVTLLKGVHHLVHSHPDALLLPYDMLILDPFIGHYYIEGG